MSARLQMPGAMPAELAEKLSDVHHGEVPVDDFKDQARDHLIERLVCGKTVHGMTAKDVFDSAADNSTPEVFEILEGLVGLSEKVGDDFQLSARDLAKRARTFIEHFVDRHPDWIEEKATSLASEAENEEAV